MKTLNSEKHILVVGGAGYIGSTLVRKLLANKYKVRVLDNLLYNNNSSIVGFLDDPHFSFIYGDFCDEKFLKTALNGVTDVIHLAALVGDPICKKYPDKAVRVNKDGSVNLFNYLMDYDINHFVFLSTCSNYGLREDDSLATEESTLNPKSLYAETKVATERFIIENTRSVDFHPTILRLSTAYGISNRMRFDLTISEFTRELALGRELLVYDETTWRPYCHVDDISQAIVTVVNSHPEKISGEVFNVGSNNGNFTKKMIVDMIQDYIPNSQIQYKKGGMDPRNYRVSFDKIHNQLGFKSAITAEIAIKNLIIAIKNGFFTDYDKNRNFYGNYQIKFTD